MTEFGFQDQLPLNAGQKYCRLQNAPILSTFIKLPFVVKIFVLFFFEWPFYTGFTVVPNSQELAQFNYLLNPLCTNVVIQAVLSSMAYFCPLCPK